MPNPDWNMDGFNRTSVVLKLVDLVEGLQRREKL